MSVRDELRHHIGQAIDDCDRFTTDPAEAVAALFWSVRRTYNEVEITTFGDAEARIMWHQDIVAELRIPVHQGVYTKPLAGGWTCLP